MNNLIKTGIPGLDDVLYGGLPDKDVVLVSGSSGSGKSLLCLQYLVNGALQKKNAIYFTFEQEVDDLISEADGIGIKIKEAMKLEYLQIIKLDPSKVSTIASQISKLSKEFGVERIAIDSLSVLALYLNVPKWKMKSMPVPDSEPKVHYYTPTTADVRRGIYKLVTEIKKIGCSTLMIAEIAEDSTWHSRDTVSEFIVDGVIRLDITTLGGSPTRMLTVKKMRHNNLDERPHKYVIEPKKGICLESISD